MIELKRPETKEEWGEVGKLFEAFKRDLWQYDGHYFDEHFNADIASLPGSYVLPKGSLWLAYSNNEPAGCLGLRKHTDDIGELKRMFTYEQFRGQGIGRKLVEQLVEDAKELGYKKLRLDTLRDYVHAHNIYYALGFKEIPPYNEYPPERVIFMEREL